MEVTKIVEPKVSFKQFFIKEDMVLGNRLLGGRSRAGNIFFHSETIDSNISHLQELWIFKSHSCLLVLPTKCGEEALIREAGEKYASTVPWSVIQLRD